MVTLPHTLRSIARQHGRDLHHARYVINKLHIKPIGIVGGARIFSDADAALISAELLKMPGVRPQPV